MASSKPQKRRTRGTFEKTSTDLVDSFRPRTPLDEQEGFKSHMGPATSSDEQKWTTKSKGLWADIRSLRWVVVPESSLKLLLFFAALWANWEILSPYVAKGLSNPFKPLLFISHRVPTSSPEDPRYQKGYLDLVFLAYYIIVWSFVRQSLTTYVCRPLARYFGIRKEGKLDRFGEQGYALVYFAFTGVWGLRIMSQLPIWWYRTERFWIDYPHCDMKPELKAYYLLQAAYWCQQFLVLVLGLEKPRKDYHQLIAHHFVTLWLVGWSYLINLTLIGIAVYVSMDIPDSFLGLSKLLNYMRWDISKIVVFAVFIVIWTYFRHYLNLIILYSVWTQFDLIPEFSKQWSPKDGVWLVWWMKYQIFAPLLLLQCLNLFWYYYFILRVAVRAITELKATDDRSDDEDDDEPDTNGKED